MATAHLSNQDVKFAILSTTFTDDGPSAQRILDTYEVKPKVLDQLLSAAARNNAPRVIKVLLAHGASNVNRSYILAVRDNKHEAERALVASGKVSVDIHSPSQVLRMYAVESGVRNTPRLERAINEFIASTRGDVLDNLIVFDGVIAELLE